MKVLQGLKLSTMLDTFKGKFLSVINLINSLGAFVNFHVTIGCTEIKQCMYLITTCDVILTSNQTALF